MHRFTLHVTHRDEIPRRVEITAACPVEAMRKALAGRPGRVSYRQSSETDVVRAALALRVSSNPLLVGAA